MGRVSEPNGQLRIEVVDDSYFLSSNVPYEVRDEDQVLVKQGRGQGLVPLPSGLYSVTVVDTSGYRQAQVVRVRSGEEASLTFVPTPTEVEESADRPTLAVTLDRLSGCSLRSHASGYWVFEPTDDLRSVPTARFIVGERRVTVSLPLNPTTPYPLNFCSVRVTSSNDAPTLRTDFAPGRRVASMVDGLVRCSDVAGSIDLTEAAMLLQEKYRDPAGAALGGLTLHRLGHLPERQSWVENLARDFEWLPDGSILLAALLSREPPSAKRGLDVLLMATGMRPLYTDGLSLGMELLRRWPTDDRKTERNDRLDSLADYSAYANWEAINLTVGDNDR